MKVCIGPYRNWIGPYQLADLLHYVGVSKDRCYRVGAWLADTWVNTACEWIHKHKKRKIVIKLDPWDSWSANHTLALIILPVLKQLQTTKHGAAIVKNEDAPESMRGSDDINTDDKVHERWDYVLGEMIWAFEQLVGEDWEAQYFEGGFNSQGYKAHQARIDNGLRLFGTYYEGLWD